MWERKTKRQKCIQTVLFKMATNSSWARLQSQLYTNWAMLTTLWHIYRIVLNQVCPRDSVNTTMIHPYSTLPRNGRIHWGETYNIKHEIQVIQRDARINRLIPESVTTKRNRGRIDLFECIGQFGCQVTRTGSLWDTCSSRLICCRPWRSSRGRDSLKL